LLADNVSCVVGEVVSNCGDGNPRFAAHSPKATHVSFVGSGIEAGRSGAALVCNGATTVVLRGANSQSGGFSSASRLSVAQPVSTIAQQQKTLVTLNTTSL
jgi:hypothetical protein